MAGRSDIEAGRAYVTLYMKNSALMKGLQQLQSNLKKLASGLKQFGNDVANIGRTVTLLGVAIGGTLLAGISKVVAKRPELAEVAKAFEAVKKAVEEVFVQIATALAPSLINLSKRFVDIAKAVGNFISKNQEMVVEAVKWTAIITGAGIVIVALGKAFALTGAAISIANTLITASSTVAAAAVAVLDLAMAPVVITGIALAAALTALSIEALAFAGAFKGVGKIVSDAANEMFSVASTAFQGITDAIASGDMQLAGKIAMTGLHTEILIGIDAIQSAWDKFKSNLVNVWIAAMRKVEEATITMAAAVVKVLNLLPGFKINFDAKGAQEESRKRAAAAFSKNIGGAEGEHDERQKAIDALKAALEAMRKEAAKGRESAGGGGTLPPPRFGGLVVPDRATASSGASNLSRALTSIGGRVPDSREAAKRSATLGTFSAAGIGLAAGGTAQSQIVVEQKKTNQLNQQQLEELRRIKFEFTA